MIRTLGNRHVPRAEARVYRVSGPVRKPRATRPARTQIHLCVVCRRAYPLHAHDDLTCARKHGLNGNDVYMMEHAV